MVVKDISRKEARKILAEATKFPEILATDRYISAKFSRPDLYGVTFQVGPLCNLECPHCYGSYGPSREGVPKLPVVKRVVQQSLVNRMSHITLTDGEPMMEENRGLMKVIAENSNELPVQIITNGKFAETEDSALDWMRFLKENGFELRNPWNLMRVSLGQGYNLKQGTYANLISAASEVFGGVSFDHNLGFYFLSLNDSKADTKCLHSAIREVDSVAGRKTQSSIKPVRRYKIEGTRAYLYYPVKGEKGYIPFVMNQCMPEGRAQNIPSVIRSHTFQPITVEGISFDPERDMNLCVDFRGNVGFGMAQSTLYGHRTYGNIMSKGLSDIRANIFRDPIYAINHLGGLRFLYHLAQEINPKFVISSATNVDFSNTLFSNKDLVEKIRRRHPRKIASTYKEYIKKRGLPHVIR